MFLIYVAGKYTDKSKWAVENNVFLSAKYAKSLWGQGWGVLCPHLNSLHMVERFGVPYESLMTFDLTIISVMDAVFLLPNWWDSKGATREWRRAIALHIPVVKTLKEAKRLLRRLTREKSLPYDSVSLHRYVPHLPPRRTTRRRNHRVSRRKRSQ